MNRFHLASGHQSVDTGINFSSYLEIVFFCTVHTIYTCIQSMLHHQTLCIYLQKNNCGWCVRLCTDAVEATGRTCWHVSQQHKHTDSRGLSSGGNSRTYVNLRTERILDHSVISHLILGDEHASSLYLVITCLRILYHMTN